MPLNIRLSKNENHLLKHLGIHCMVNIEKKKKNWGGGGGEYVAFYLQFQQCHISVVYIYISTADWLPDLSFRYVFFKGVTGFWVAFTLVSMVVPPDWFSS